MILTTITGNYQLPLRKYRIFLTLYAWLPTTNCITHTLVSTAPPHDNYVFTFGENPAPGG